MKTSVLWLRGAREMLGLSAWSEHAEKAYFDALDIDSDEVALRALRACLRRCDAIPSPLQLRKVASQLARQAAESTEISHG